MKILFEADDYAEMTHDDLVAMLASKPSNEIADRDWIDSHTGEVYWEKGERAGASHYHPEAEARREAETEDANREWEAERLQWEKEDEDAVSDAEQSLDAAIEKFIGNIEQVEDDMFAQDVASDVASGFFHSYPEWRRWVSLLDINPESFKAGITDRVYGALIGESIDLNMMLVLENAEKTEEMMGLLRNVMKEPTQVNVLMKWLRKNGVDQASRDEFLEMLKTGNRVEIVAYSRDLSCDFFGSRPTSSGSDTENTCNPRKHQGKNVQRKQAVKDKFSSAKSKIKGFFGKS